MPSVITPYMPIEVYEKRQIVDDEVNESHEPDEVISKDIFDNLPTNSSDFGREGFSRDVALILHGMGMGKYIGLFQTEDINLDTFRKLVDQDLVLIGISDASDRELIVKNLRETTGHQNLGVSESSETVIMPANQIEDLVMAKHILNQIALLKCYTSYIRVQLGKEKFVDYFVSDHLTAVGVLNLVTDRCVTQSKKVTNSLYGEKNSNSLIKLILNTQDVANAATIEKNLLAKKSLKKLKLGKVILKVFVVVGFSSMGYLIAKNLISR